MSESSASVNWMVRIHKFISPNAVPFRKKVRSLVGESWRRAGYFGNSNQWIFRVFLKEATSFPRVYAPRRNKVRFFSMRVHSLFDRIRWVEDFIQQPGMFTFAIFCPFLREVVSQSGVIYSFKVSNRGITVSFRNLIGREIQEHLRGRNFVFWVALPCLADNVSRIQFLILTG